MIKDNLSRLRIDKQENAPSKWRKRPFLVLFILLGLAALIFWLSRAVFFPTVEIETVSVSQVYPSSAFTILNASGYVVAQRKAALASKATGRLEWLGVEEGSRVSRGEVIARLEAMDAEASRRQASAALDSSASVCNQAKVELSDSEKNLKRLKELLSQGYVSQADFDLAEARKDRAVAALSAAEANVKVAQASLSGADVSLDYTRIRAPFDGVVLTKNADVGDIVTPLGAAANAKASVVTIADLASLRVEADVSESSLQKVRVSQPCEITLDALPQNRFRGIVHSIVPTADRSKATVMVKVSFVDNDPKILPEMSAKVSFLERPLKPEDQTPATALPRSAVVAMGGKNFVFVVKGDKVIQTEVVTGTSSGDMMEIRSGVKPGDKVAAKPLEKLKNGSRVKIRQK
jgi:RND family efflux transporter MFP subunit